MSYKFSDFDLKQALVRADQYYIEALPKETDIEHKFASRFVYKMNKLINRSKKTKIVTKLKWHKRAAVIFITLAILMASAMSVSAVRKVVFEFISHVYETYTEIFFESQSVPNETFVPVMPSYIPAGFILKEENMEDYIYSEYVKGSEYILYEQERLDQVSLRINTEGIRMEDRDFNGLSAKYYSNQGVQNIIWYDDTYMYSISSTLNEEEIFKIARSVNKE
jgi:hypothetical protein